MIVSNDTKNKSCIRTFESFRYLIFEQSNESGEHCQINAKGDEHT